MPISSFRLKSTIGRNYKTDFDDTLRLKEALENLGYYDTPPSYGRTGYPDEAMFDGIERFQSDHGLQRDGIMKPGGETERAISALRVSRTEEDKEPRAGSSKTGDIQLAGAGTIVGKAGQILAPLILWPIAEKAGRNLGKRYDGENGPEPANENERSSVANPVPAVPPQSPPKLDNKTESPATPPNVPSTLINPIPSPNIPNTLIYPAPDKELTEFGNNVERNERPDTKDQIDRIRDWFYETHDPEDWIQHGGRNRLTGKDIPEYYIPGPAGDFDRGDGRSADGRKGSRRTDLTFINKKTGRRIHFQTADVDKNGQVNSRERAAEEDIWRHELRRSQDPARPGSVQLHIIPKSTQMEKYRRIP